MAEPPAADRAEPARGRNVGRIVMIVFGALAVLFALALLAGGGGLAVGEECEDR